MYNQKMIALNIIDFDHTCGLIAIGLIRKWIYSKSENERMVQRQKFCNNLGIGCNLLYAVVPLSPLDLSDKPSCSTYSLRCQVKGTQVSDTSFVIPAYCVHYPRGFNFYLSVIQSQIFPLL